MAPSPRTPRPDGRSTRRGSGPPRSCRSRHEALAGDTDLVLDDTRWCAIRQAHDRVERDRVTVDLEERRIADRDLERRGARLDREGDVRARPDRAALGVTVDEDRCVVDADQRL